MQIGHEESPSPEIVKRDRLWMAACIALSQRARPVSAPNPNVGCLIVRDGYVVGRGWTQAGGRPHAEAMALQQAGRRAQRATVYASLEPCAHISARGPSCADLLIQAGVGEVVIATQDPDPRTNGQGIARLRAAGINVRLSCMPDEARRAMAPWWTRQLRQRPYISLKLATSLDGCIAMADGSSRWITGDRARAHGHLERARHQAILVGRGTYDADAPTLDVRLAGMEQHSPKRLMLTSQPAPDGWTALASPDALRDLEGVDSLLIEGGAKAAAAFLQADMVDRLLLYRAPILLGGGRPCLADIGLEQLADAHGRWQHRSQHRLGSDQLDVYERIRKD